MPLATDAEDAILNKVALAMDSPRISRIERHVLWVLSNEDAFGLEKAVSITRIVHCADYPGTSEREVGDAVKTLVASYDVPIGRGNNGYYFILAALDANE